MRTVSISLGSTPAPLSAMSEDAPQSTRHECLFDSARMHVWKRPPLPKASPLPRNRIRTLAMVLPRCGPTDRALSCAAGRGLC